MTNATFIRRRLCEGNCLVLVVTSGGKLFGSGNGGESKGQSMAGRCLPVAVCHSTNTNTFLTTRPAPCPAFAVYHRCPRKRYRSRVFEHVNGVSRSLTSFKSIPTCECGVCCWLRYPLTVCVPHLSWARILLTSKCTWR